MKTLVGTLVLLVLSVLVLRLGEPSVPPMVLIAGTNQSGFRQLREFQARELEQKFGFRVLSVELPGGTSGVPRLLEEADLLILYSRPGSPADTHPDALRLSIESGKSVVQILIPEKDPGGGAQMPTHRPNDSPGPPPIQTFAVPSMDHHPVLRGMPRHVLLPGVSSQTTGAVPEGAESLILGRIDQVGPAWTLAWAREDPGGSRQFALRLPNQTSLDRPEVRHLIHNAFSWALRRPIPPRGVLGWGTGELSAAKPRAYPRPPSRPVPGDAEVLFDGRNLSLWDSWSADPRTHDSQLGHLNSTGWTVSDGITVATLGSADIVTRRQLGDYRLNLDFLIPATPGAVEPSWRGNSGVYLNSRYEFQILDSTMEDQAGPTSCGAITGIRAPDVLACREAGHWQNLEVVFKAARFQNGVKVAPARLTAVLNEVTIHDNVEIPSPTVGGIPEKAVQGLVRGPLRLQVDSEGVQFANIWVRPLSSEERIFYFPETPPLTGRPWVDMDYGPFLTASIEAPWPAGNIANKGIAIPMSKVYGNDHDEAVIFDTDLLRYSVGWRGNFVNLRGVVFDGTHQTHPLIDGTPFFANPVKPGWARDGSFEDPRELPWGPLPKNWAHFKGLYLHRNKVIFSYTVGETRVLEMPGLENIDGAAGAFSREINLGPAAGELTLQVAYDPGSNLRVVSLDGLDDAWPEAEASACLAVGGNLDKLTVAAAVGAPPGSRWVLSPSGDLRLRIPPSDRDRKLKVLVWNGPSHHLQSVGGQVRNSHPAMDLAPFTGGGPARWRQKLVTQGQLGDESLPYAVDTIAWPTENPWRSWLRFGGFDFFPDGRRAILCTWNGDVWSVSGIGSGLRKLTWQRMATGLFQPLGVKIVDNKIHILGRDQITILHDLNRDGETDYYQNFNNDHQVTEHFHEFAMDLQTDAEGDFYYMKGGRHALDSLIPQHGTLIRVARDGSESEILAHGFRAPNGLLVTPDGEFISSDQQGQWVPANRINVIRPGGFYGYMWSYHRGDRPTRFEEPLAWIHPSINRSPASFTWVDSDLWGPFENRIISPSYGTGKLELLLTEVVGGVPQGGVTRFPIDFDTGIMRGRFHPKDGQLYLCGLFGWASNKTRPGGFYRVRYTGKPVNMVNALRVGKEGVTIGFTDKLDPLAATDAGNYHVQVWNYRWTEQYGSPDFKLNGQEGRDQLVVQSVALSRDRRTVFLKLPGLSPVMQMHIDLNLKSLDGSPIRTFVHNTVHGMGDWKGDELTRHGWLAGDQVTKSGLSDPAPGLIQEIRSVSSEPVEPDARRVRLAALFVPAGQPPSPFLPSGQFRARWRGFLKLDLNEEVRFHTEGRGEFRLRVGGRVVSFSAPEGDRLDNGLSESIPLRSGLNTFEMDYSSPPAGEAVFRLSWSSDERLQEPIPATAFFHDGGDPMLQEGQRLRYGREIFAQQRCAHCHLPEKPFDEENMPELQSFAPRLDGIGDRLTAEWLQRWIENPQALKPDSHMPQLLGGPNQQARTADIVSFLTSLKSATTPVSTGRAANSEVVSTGEELFNKLGCVGCHPIQEIPPNPELPSLRNLDSKWRPGALAAYLRAPERYNSWSRMPNFDLSQAETGSLAGYLLSLPGDGAASSSRLPEGDPDRGRQLVVSLGCLNCHQLSGLNSTLKAPPLKELSGKAWTTSCLAETHDPLSQSPQFAFTGSQRDQVASFLKDHSTSLRRRDWVEFSMRQQNQLRCRTCHDLDSSSSRWSPLRALVDGTNTSLTEEETIHLKIPPLTWAGEQFRPEWIESLVAGNLETKTRPHLVARMPAFVAYAPGLARGLAAQHGFASASTDRPAVSRQLAEVGSALIEKDALGCVDCHAVGPRRALAGRDTETINFNLISQRLRHEFYWRFLRDPQQILPGTMMPTFMDRGRSTLPTVYAGDARQQSEALWHFMRSLRK